MTPPPGETRRFKVMFLHGCFTALEASAFWHAMMSQSWSLPINDEYFAQPDEVYIKTAGFTCVVGTLTRKCQYMQRCYPIPHSMDAYTYWLERHYWMELERH